MQTNRKLRRPWLGTAGNAAVEAALAFPLVLTLTTGIANYGFGVYDHMQLVSAVRAGSQVAMKDATNTAAIQAAVEAALSIDQTGLDVSVTRSCQCADGTTVSCSTGSCTSGSVRSYVTVAASLPHQWLFSYPAPSGSTTMTADSVIRTQ